MLPSRQSFFIIVGFVVFVTLVAFLCIEAPKKAPLVIDPPRFVLTPQLSSDTRLELWVIHEATTGRQYLCVSRSGSGMAVVEVSADAVKR